MLGRLAMEVRVTGYRVGDKPPNLQNDGSFDTPLGVRVKSVVGENGEILVVDQAAGLFVEVNDDGE
jgi:hypothetical protein